MNKSNQASQIKAFLAIIAFIVFALVGEALGTGWAILSLVVLVGGYFVANEMSWRAAERKAQEELQAREDRIRVVVGKHKRVLLRKRRQGSFTDEYGMLNDKRWQGDLRHFVNKVLPVELGPEDLDDWLNLSAYIEEILDELTGLTGHEELDAGPPLLKSSHSLGLEFEHRCAEVLRNIGWHATVTVASGDQGVDIEAEREGYRIVVQCKFYSSPVGNAAVQEIAAGVLHYQADRGVVVSQSSFTQAARRLAQTTDVLLVDFDDLQHIDALLDGNEIEENSDARIVCEAPADAYPIAISGSSADSHSFGLGSRFKRARRLPLEPSLHREKR